MKGPKIKEMLLAGKNYPEISRKLEVAVSTIAYHARAIGKQKYQLIRQQHDWQQIQLFYDEGHSINEIKSSFHIDSETLRGARERGELVFAERGCSDRKSLLRKTRVDRGKTSCPNLVDMLIVDSPHATSVIRKAIKRQGLIPYHCFNEECCLHGDKTPVWNGKTLVLHLDHKNGKRTDHRVENLRWLCPNCHSQTETYCGRNKIGDGCG